MRSCETIQEHKYRQAELHWNTIIENSSRRLNPLGIGDDHTRAPSQMAPVVFREQPTA